MMLRGIDSKAVGCRERILELLEGGVGGDGVGHVLCPLCFEVVAPEPANEGRGKVLRGIDSEEGQAGSVLERGEGLVESEPLRESLGAVGTELVIPETEKERQGVMSKGADSRYLKASTCTCTCTWGEKHALELAKRAVGLEHIAESYEAAHFAAPADVVHAETMRQKASTVSGR